MRDRTLERVVADFIRYVEQNPRLHRTVVNNHVNDMRRAIDAAMSSGAEGDGPQSVDAAASHREPSEPRCASCGCEIVAFEGRPPNCGNCGAAIVPSGPVTDAEAMAVWHTLDDSADQPLIETVKRICTAFGNQRSGRVAPNKPESGPVVP